MVKDFIIPGLVFLVLVLLLYFVLEVSTIWSFVIALIGFEVAHVIVSHVLPKYK